MENLLSPREVVFTSCFSDLLDSRRKEFAKGGRSLFVCDGFFKDNDDFLGGLPIRAGDELVFVEPFPEPTTASVDILTQRHLSESDPIDLVVGIGGGATLDIAKAVSVLLRNPQPAGELQGWDLVQNPAVPKIGIPTIFGTGAEASRTAVLVNNDSGLKLGINSNFSQFDLVIIDHLLQRTIPKSLLLTTASDAYFHAFEILRGSRRNPASDALASLAGERFLRGASCGDLYADQNLLDIACASYFGGLALTGGTVGLVHPLSAALGVVFGLGHTYANILALRALETFYPEEHDILFGLLDLHGVEMSNLFDGEPEDATVLRIMELTLLHEKPLSNALGDNFRSQLTPELFADFLGRT